MFLFCADFLWLSDSVLLSCSKDGKLVQQLFNEAEKPIERAVSDVICCHNGSAWHSVGSFLCLLFHIDSNIPLIQA